VYLPKSRTGEGFDPFSFRADPCTDHGRSLYGSGKNGTTCMNRFNVGRINIKTVSCTDLYS